jgi:hypothetical protein
MLQRPEGIGPFWLSNPTISINFPGGATGANPSGIPYSVAGHIVSSITTSQYYYSPTSGTESSGVVSAISTAITPTECTPSMTIYSYVPEVFTWGIYAVKPVSTSGTWTIGSSLASCTTGASTGGTAITCTATAPLQPVGTLMTITAESGTLPAPSGCGNATAGLIIAFSCQ